MGLVCIERCSILVYVMLRAHTHTHTHIHTHTGNSGPHGEGAIPGY